MAQYCEITGQPENDVQEELVQATELGSTPKVSALPTHPIIPHDSTPPHLTPHPSVCVLWQVAPGWKVELTDGEYYFLRSHPLWCEYKWPHVCLMITLTLVVA